MIEAYKIAVNMTLTGDAHKKMTEFSRLVEKTNRDVERLLATMRTTNRSFISFGSELRTSTSAVRGFDHSLTALGSHANRVTQQVNSLRSSVRGLNAATRSGVGGGGGGGGGGFGTGAALGYLGRRFAPAAVGYGAYRLSKASFSEVGEYNAGLAKVRAMGYGEDVVSEVERATRSGKPSLAPTTQIHAYVSALMATQNPQKAKNLFPTIAKAMSFAPTIFGGMNAHQFDEATRAAEMLAGGDEKKMQSAFSDVLGMVALSGGTIQPAKIKQLIRKNPSLSRLGMFELEPVVQEMGGDVVSTALRTGKMQLLKGQMGKFQAAGLKDLGILGQVRYDKNGRPIGSKYGDLNPNLRELAFSNPTEFLKTELLPRLAKKGVTDPKEIVARLNFLFANTYGQLFENIYKNLPKSEMIRNRAENVGGIDILKDISPPQAQATLRLSEAMKSLHQAIGEFQDPFVLKGMDLLSGFLERLANALRTDNAASVHPFSESLITKAGRAATGYYKEHFGGGQPMVIHMDGQRVGNIMFKKMTGNTMVQNGTNQTNYLLGGGSNNVSNIGAFNQ